MMDFFASCGDRGRETWFRVEADRRMRQIISGRLREQEEHLCGAEVDVRDFSPHYKPDPGEVFAVEEYRLPEHIQDAISNRDSIDVLNTRPLAEIPAVRAFVARERRNDEDVVLFQYLGERGVLRPDWKAVFLRRDTIEHIDAPGLLLDDQLVAVYRDGTLFFRSYALAHRVVNLSLQFVEATAEDVQAFVQHERLVFRDLNVFESSTDQWVRRKIGLILHTGILDNCNLTVARGAIEDLKEEGLEVELEFEGEGADMKLVIPKEKPKMKDALRFLEEGFYKGYLSGTVFYANSRMKA